MKNKSFEALLLDAIKARILQITKKEIEKAKQHIEKEINTIVAEVAISVGESVSFEDLSHHLIITIKKNNEKK